MQYSIPLKTLNKNKRCLLRPNLLSLYRFPTAYIYIYIYMYSAECLKRIKKNKKAAAEVNQFHRIKGKLTFKLNVSTKLY
jgi:hypothetical protein